MLGSVQPALLIELSLEALTHARHLAFQRTVAARAGAFQRHPLFSSVSEPCSAEEMPRSRRRTAGVQEAGKALRREGDLAHAKTTFVFGVDLFQPDRPCLGAGCRRFGQHDRNREHELCSLAVQPGASIGGNRLDLRFLDGT